MIENSVLRRENEKLTQRVDLLREHIDELDGERIGWMKRAIAAEEELNRAKFHADEFHQADEDMELVVTRMWGAVTRHDVRHASIEQELVRQESSRSVFGCSPQCKCVVCHDV
jgi:hypothetical protein